MVVIGNFFFVIRGGLIFFYVRYMISYFEIYFSNIVLMCDGVVFNIEVFVGKSFLFVFGE